jgi:hypothetical protein
MMASDNGAGTPGDMPQDASRPCVDLFFTMWQCPLSRVKSTRGSMQAAGLVVRTRRRFRLTSSV